MYPEGLTITFSNFDRISYRALNIFTTLLGFHRVFIFFLPKINEYIFNPRRLKNVVIVIWALLVGYTLINSVIGCYTTFDAVNGDFQYKIRDLVIIFLQSISFFTSATLTLLLPSQWWKKCVFLYSNLIIILFRDFLFLPTTFPMFSWSAIS